MTFFRALASVTILIGAILGAIGGFRAAYEFIDRPGQWYSILMVGLFLMVAGSFLLVALTLLDSGIDEFKEARESRENDEADAPYVDEVTAARVKSMWSEEADKVRRMLEEFGWDAGTDDTSD